MTDSTPVPDDDDLPAMPVDPLAGEGRRCGLVAIVGDRKSVV